MKLKTLKTTFILICFLSMFTLNVQAYELLKILTSQDVDPDTLVPLGVSEVFLTDSAWVVCWVNLSDIETEFNVRFDWIDPANNLYAAYPVLVEDPGEGFFWEWYTVYAWMSIQDYPPSDMVGTWSVRVYAEDVFIGSTTFNIVDLDSYAQEISLLLEEIDELNSDYTELLSEYDGLTGDYNELISAHNQAVIDYNELQIDYNNQIVIYNELQIDYNDQIEDYNELQSEYNGVISDLVSLESDYDALINDYNDLLYSFANTRNLFYVSVAGIIIFLITTIYFATRSRSAT